MKFCHLSDGGRAAGCLALHIDTRMCRLKDLLEFCKRNLETSGVEYRERPAMHFRSSAVIGAVVCLRVGIRTNAPKRNNAAKHYHYQDCCFFHYIASVELN
uniref:Uncharacterized protein n=1 Tax=Candidatus Methanogaster sp. ANME-2c ERB4 TaxID=2759911 RepID=A0A7G9YCI6_9EURY|nr:hypothetical protein LBDFMPMG_00001 [Methanosarcinales archaeon ANME-2c ERB4]